MPISITGSRVLAVAVLAALPSLVCVATPALAHQQAQFADDPATGLRHRFTQDETQFLFDAAKAGGKVAVTLGCQAIVPAPGNVVCPQMSDVIVNMAAEPFAPKGRCLEVWAEMETTPPVGAQYIDCGDPANT